MLIPKSRPNFWRVGVAVMAVIAVVGCKGAVAPQAPSPPAAETSAAAPAPTQPAEPIVEPKIEKPVELTVTRPETITVPARPMAPPLQSPAAQVAPGAPVVRAVTGLPSGPGRDLTQRVCSSCHAIGMVTAKGRSEQEWAEIIGRMQALGLEANDDDLYTIHEYLSRELPPRR